MAADSKQKPMRENAKERLQRMLDFETPFISTYCAVAGMDEVGRGPLAGPVVVACLVLPQDSAVLGVNDSKKISEPKRETLSAALLAEAIGVSYGVVNSREIDEINILRATHVAAERAVAGLQCQVDFLLCDELRGFCLPFPGQMLVGGDALSYRIAAASIVAKVYRDGMMKDFHEKYPEYGFAQHKGYGTAAHVAAIKEHGPCPIHRRSFLSKILD